MFSNNTAYDGGAISVNHKSHISFEGNSTVKFISNRANYDGGAIHAYYDGHVSFEDDSTTEFSNNRADYDGGAIFISNLSSHVSFEDDSTTEFCNNSAGNDGGGISANDKSLISFENNSTTKFINNRADNDGGAISANNNNHVSFEDNSTAKFSNNSADGGGAISVYYDSLVSFEDNSTIEFSNNRADKQGGTISAHYDSHVSFEDNSTIEFSNNRAGYNGGAISAYDNNSHVSFEDNSTTKFSNNRAGYNGGAISAYDNHVSFEDNSTTEFSNNRADYGDGGAIIAYYDCNVLFKDNSATKFSNNNAYKGGVIYAEDGHVSFKDDSTTKFSHNNALSDNNAILTRHSGYIIFDDNCTVSFFNNITTVRKIVYPISTANSKVIARGNFTITFNHRPVKWCANACYSDKNEYDDVRIDNFGIVWCRDQNRFICKSKNCQCKNLEDVISNNSSATLSDKLILSSAFNLSIFQNIGQNNLAVICVNGGRLQVEFCNNLTIQDITWIGCESALKVYNSKHAMIRNCSFLHSKGRSIEILEASGDITVNYCKFIHNSHYRGHGSAIHYSSKNLSTDDLTSTININNSHFSFNIGSKSLIYLRQSLQRIVHHFIHNSTFQNNQGTSRSVYLSGHQNININGDLVFEAENGTGLYITDYSTVTFGESSTVKFINNTADQYGVAIFLNNHSSVVFDKNSIVNLNDNYATNGTIYSNNSSLVLFKATCKVTFNGNKVRQYGAGIHSVDNSHITFTENSNATFSNNIIPTNGLYQQFGGIIFTEDSSYVIFEGKSTTLFSNNTADIGAGSYSVCNSSVKFRDQSRILFNYNIALHCGVLTTLLSSISFNDNADVIYNANKLSCPSNNCLKPSAGAICSLQGSDVTLSGCSSVTFTNNTADHGSGAIVLSESTLNNSGTLYDSI